MKKFFCFMMAMMMASAAVLRADVATPYPVQMKQPDGSTIVLRIHGDEFYSWYTSEDGATLYERSADGWWRPSGSARLNAPALQRANELRARRESQIRPRSRDGLGLGWGSNHFLVLLIEWSDMSFQAGAEDYFRRALNEPGFSDNGCVGSARDYYIDASYGGFSPVFDVIGPVTLNRGQYDFPQDDTDGKHYEMAREMIKEAVQILDGSVDFSIYDNDHDGSIDNIYFFYPGYGADSGVWGAIWPHSSIIVDDNNVYDGVKIGTYACSSEMYGNYSGERIGIGTFCHEFGHVIGLPDLYDTDEFNNGSARNPSSWNLMAAGNHNAKGRIPARMSTYERYLLGYLTAEDIQDLSAEGEKNILNLSEKVFYKLPSGNDGEFFLPEVRDGRGWDSPLPPGLILYHIDRSQNLVGGRTAAWRWDNWQLINGYRSHPCDYILLAEQTDADMDYRRWVFPSNTELDYHTTSRELDAWDGTIPYNLTNIAYADGKATFTVSAGRRSVSGFVTSAVDGSAISKAVVVVSRPNVSTRAKAVTLTAARQESLYETTTDEKGLYVVKLSEDDPMELDVYVFASNYIAAMETLTGRIMRKNFSMTPVIAEPVDKVLTKANLPTDAVAYYGYSQVGQNYTVAQKFTAEELKEHVGKTLASISFNCRADGEEVYVFVDFGTTTRALMQRVWYVDTGISGSLINQVDVSAENLRIPADTDLYVGYLIKNANTGYAIWTDDPRTGKANPGGFYLQNVFSTQPGGKWIDPRIDWSSPTTNAMIGFTVRSEYELNEGASLMDMGLCYIVLPSSLKAGENLDLTLEISRSHTPVSITWRYDGKRVEGTTITLTPGRHTILADIYFIDGDQQSIESVITVEQ